MARTKLVALLLGPTGVGLVGLYVSITGLVGSISGLGIATSGVRAVAEAYASGDDSRVARIVRTLRRVCWITGIFGWALTSLLAYPLSIWALGSDERVLSVALLGATLLISSLSGGQAAILQGARRVKDLAMLSIITMLVGTIASVLLYYWLREDGIITVLIVTAVIHLGFSWWFARRIKIKEVYATWPETWKDSKRLLGLGVAFMFGGLLTTGVALAIRSEIVRELGLEANGIFQAAWALSGLFAGFILGAMSTDFYPRVTAVAHDHPKVNCIVNEQTEIGVLLALPGLLGTLAFAPFLMHVFYTVEFLPGAELLPWFVLGIFGQVVSWPMGFSVVAIGSGGWYVVIESCANIVRLGLSIFLLRWLGLWGVALAVPLLYIFHTTFLRLVCGHLTKFRWTYGTLRLQGTSAALVGAAFLSQQFLSGYYSYCFGGLITALGAIYSLRGIVARLNPEHRAIRMLFKVPGFRHACGIHKIQ